MQLKVLKPEENAGAQASIAWALIAASPATRKKVAYMISTREIPRTEWTTFFNDFSRKYEGQGVTLEVFSPEIGDQVEERDFFLSGITAELADGGDKIEIMMGGSPTRHLTHVISKPTKVGFEKTVPGTKGALQITSEDGATALLHLL